MRPKRMSVIVCVLALIVVVGRGAQMVLSHAASETKAHVQLAAAESRVDTGRGAAAPASRAYAPPRPRGTASQVPEKLHVISVRVDVYGLPEDVSTDTGKPPTTNQPIIATHAGKFVPVSGALEKMVHEHTYSGDWSVPGVWHPWIGSA